MTETLTAAGPSARTTTDPTIGFRRTASALALPLAFACQLVMNAVYAWAAGDGGGDTGGGAEALAFYGAHADAIQIGLVFSLIGGFLTLPGVLAALRMLRPTRPRLSLIAGILMIVGYVSYFGIAFTTFDSIALAQHGVDAGAAMDAAQQNPVALPFFLVFVVGNLLGTLLLGLAVILSRDLPWYAGALIIGWPVGHIVNITGGGEWFAVAGGALEVAGLAIVAAAALRTSNREWALRG